MGRSLAGCHPTGQCELRDDRGWSHAGQMNEPDTIAGACSIRRLEAILAKG
jgi:hypothetical protein